jgi:hypothetical protein
MKCIRCKHEIDEVTEVVHETGAGNPICDNCVLSAAENGNRACVCCEPRGEYLDEAIAKEMRPRIGIYELK